MSGAVLAAAPPPSLWRNGEFLRLWFAQAVSKAGTAVTEVALPLTAVLVLGATPGQMAALVIAGQLPNLLFGLLAGVWVDRARRRPILIGSDLARLLLFGSIPVAAACGLLTLAQLWVVAFVAATFSLFSLVASVSVLPTIVPASQLIAANSRLQAADAVASIGGQSLGGALVQLLGAPKAIAVDAVSYLVSAMSLRGVGKREQQPDRAKRGRVGAEVAEGVRELFRTPVLRAIAISAAVGAFAGAIQATVLMLYLADTLRLSPAVIGTVFAGMALGSVCGAAIAGRTSRWFGIGPMIILGALALTFAAVLVPLAAATGAVVAVLVAAQFLAGLGFTVYRVNHVSLRQAVTPRHLLGRVTSARTFLIFCAAPPGAALGGYLGTTVGLRPALLVAAAVMCLQPLGLLASPVRRVRTAAVPAQP